MPRAFLTKTLSSTIYMLIFTSLTELSWIRLGSLTKGALKLGSSLTCFLNEKS